VSLDVDKMLWRQAGEPRDGVREDETALGHAERRMKEHLALIGKTDLAGVEGCVPQSREEQAAPAGRLQRWGTPASRAKAA
jgi:hypothetical protein